MAPAAAPTRPTPNPTVEIVDFDLSESMSDWDEAGHVLFVHAPSSVDFVLNARTPNTVPIARPTPLWPR